MDGRLRAANHAESDSRGGCALAGGIHPADGRTTPPTRPFRGKSQGYKNERVHLPSLADGRSVNQASMSCPAHRPADFGSMRVPSSSVSEREWVKAHAKWAGVGPVRAAPAAMAFLESERARVEPE